MSFFGNIFGGSNEPESFTKEEAFCGILLGVIAADGHISNEEVDDFHSAVGKAKVLSNVNQQQFKGIIDKMLKLLRKEGGYSKMLELSVAGLPENLRKGTFAIACDLIFSDGTVDAEEVKLMDYLKNKLGIDDATASKVAEVMQMKASV